MCSPKPLKAGFWCQKFHSELSFWRNRNHCHLHQTGSRTAWIVFTKDNRDGWRQWQHCGHHRWSNHTWAIQWPHQHSWSTRVLGHNWENIQQLQGAIKRRSWGHPGGNNTGSQRHMVKSWDQMAAAEVDAVIHTIHKPSCVTLFQSPWWIQRRCPLVDTSYQDSHHRRQPWKTTSSHYLTACQLLQTISLQPLQIFHHWLKYVMKKHFRLSLLWVPDHYARSMSQKNSLIWWWFQSYPGKEKSSSRRSGQHYCPDQVHPSW